MALPQYQLQNRNYTTDFLLYNQHNLDFDAPYQRGHVWTIEQRRNLIRSILMGIPYGAIILNNRQAVCEYDTDKTTEVFGVDSGRAIIDGKQRVTTIIMFMWNKFTVPAQWFEDKDLDTAASEVHFSQLSERGRRRFENRPLAILEGQLPSLEAEEEIFDLINFAGTPQDSKEGE